MSAWVNINLCIEGMLRAVEFSRHELNTRTAKLSKDYEGLQNFRDDVR